MSINDTVVTVHPLVAAAARLSDDSLVARVEDLARCSRATTVELLAHLGELERRKLHRGRGCGKLFPYCTEVLGFSEASAWNRMKAARAARRFPIVLDLLAAGRVNLTTIRLLAPHLTPENHRALLDEASGLPRRAVDKIVARLDPKPDVASVIRKLPARSTPSSPVATDSGASDGGHPSVVPNPGAPQAPYSVPQVAGSESAASSPARRGVIAPLRPGRYKLEVTLGAEEHDDLRWLQDAMRREIADGDPAAIVRRALKALRAQVEKKAFAATDRPKAAGPVTPGSVRRGSRHVPADVQRRVWQRDQGRCAFVARDGRRCSETSYLEFHHVEPYGIGGETVPPNISLRCRAHNQYEAELVFGERAVRLSLKRGQGEGGGARDSNGEGGAARASL
jgi:hypothetical protein